MTGSFSCTITTNAELPFAGSKADSIWVSLDGVNGYHEEVRGKGTFAKLEKNIAECGFCMSGEKASVFAFKLDTIFAGLKLRI